MTLRLTGEDTARLRAATAALLSPLAGPDPLGWWRETEARLHALFPGATAMLSLPNGEHLRNDSQSVDGAQLALMNAISRADPRTGMHGSSDPSGDFWTRWRRANAMDVWNLADGAAVLTAHGFDLRRNIVYHEGLAPAGFADFACAASVVPSSEVYLTVGYGRPSAPRRFGDEREVLSLLLPALQVAHHALHAFAPRRAALVASLDAMRDALLVVDADGRVLHQNAALRDALAADPGRDAVLATMRAMADELRALRHGAAVVTPARAAVTPAPRYALRASYAPAALWGSEGLVQVALEPFAPDAAAAPAALTALTALTAREAEVARLLARRLSNAEVAAALGVSAHTARHHTEKVMQKLGVRKRAGVATALGG
jgi:DNA-binding CsgD family transcriptional regulator/PAS domain-containing protein